ncbi:MAG: tRNA (adenosine(37)-N6)-dimethylallyltransferase MiaA [Chitinophagaceae bacterium]
MTPDFPQKTVIIIAGPTAVGKTSIAVDLALDLNTEIISADSRQCYRELDIGVARPSPEELAAVPHHFIASHSIHEEINAAGFEKYALEKVNELFKKKNTVVMAGGTGLYIKAFTDGLDPVPQVSSEIRQEIASAYDSGGMEWLHAELTRTDPQFASKGEMMNPQRMKRALEVIRATGTSILEFQKGASAARDFRIVKTAIGLPREVLNKRINERVEQMMAKGQLQEAQGLMPFKHLNALRTVGYTELFDYLDGKTSLEEAVALISQHTRQYAKRQMTWFKKDPGITWFTPSEGKSLRELVNSPGK